ncbi:mitochondrial intermembrane space import and assembly protein 40 homolog isoform X2 [Carica papaya]|uniref:mitochondrial intermembrane space import and assembly protein 40 homolog isoform X2 n=1 Tax=Carica papaya TaxID=3649 RepID=UPI000B8D1A53|nr:mitochondrial intermembrane space import and assembly protein 40 homolog isoform X2 [Carica papaya]
MGQVESKKPSVVDAADQSKSWHSSSVPSPPVDRQDYRSFSAPMNSLSAETAAYDRDENKSLEDMAKKALECPCIADLRNGPCGSQFSSAFLCFLKSTAEEQVG